ncbi:MAG: hypothetical protein ACLQMF_09620 [Rectinemataceae bacterium]
MNRNSASHPTLAAAGLLSNGLLLRGLLLGSTNGTGSALHAG